MCLIQNLSQSSRALRPNQYGDGDLETSVLVSARIEFIFFLVAGIALYSGLRMRMLITHRCFSCC